VSKWAVVVGAAGWCDNPSGPRGVVAVLVVISDVVDGVSGRVPKKTYIPGSFYRGFKPNPGGIHIIIFCVTTRLQSKSNRCL
jgi:hypothetical protein